MNLEVGEREGKKDKVDDGGKEECLVNTGWSLKTCASPFWISK